MDIKAITCLRSSPIKDSIIQNDMLQIFNLKERVVLLNNKSNTLESSYNDEKEVSKNLTADLKKSRNWNKRVLIGGPLVGLLIGILIMN